MAVVAAFELDDLAATGSATGQADGTHPGFGTATDQAHHVHAGHQFQNLFGQFHFAFGGRAKRKPFRGCFLNGLQHRRVAVAQNHGTPGADVIDIALAIGVPEMGTLRALHKTGCSTHGLEGAYRRIDAARNDLLGALEQLQVAVSVECHWERFQSWIQGLRHRHRVGPRTAGRE